MRVVLPKHMVANRKNVKEENGIDLVITASGYVFAICIFILFVAVVSIK